MPAPHGLQAFRSSPSALLVPGMQGKQNACPFLGATKPCGQLMQVFCSPRPEPTATEKVPFGHGVQEAFEDAPRTVLPYRPGPHWMQPEAELTALAANQRPGGQPLH